MHIFRESRACVLRRRTTRLAPEGRGRMWSDLIMLQEIKMHVIPFDAGGLLGETPTFEFTGVEPTEEATSWRGGRMHAYR